MARTATRRTGVPRAGTLRTAHHHAVELRHRAVHVRTGGRHLDPEVDVEGRSPSRPAEDERDDDAPRTLDGPPHLLRPEVTAALLHAHGEEAVGVDHAVRVVDPHR